MLNEEQLKKLAKLFEEEILPVIKAYPKEFEEMSEKANKFLEDREKHQEE